MRTEVKVAFSVNKWSIDNMGLGAGALKPSVYANITQPDGKMVWEQDDCDQEEFTIHAVATAMGNAARRGTRMRKPPPSKDVGP